jgi:type IX secretion system PorP/SprF family membrane protein
VKGANGPFHRFYGLALLEAQKFHALKTLGFTFLLLTCISIDLSGQFFNHTSNYRYNPFLLNPAVAGSDGQWAGFASFQHEIPSLTTVHHNGYSGSLSGHGLLSERVGLGASLTLDNSLFAHQSGVQVAGSYLLPLGDGNLSIGIAGGIRFSRSNIDNYLVPEYNSYTMSTGVQYKSEKLFVGISAMDLAHYTTSAFFDPLIIWTATGGYRIDLSEIAIEPVATAFFVPAADFVAMDIMAKVLLNDDKFMVGTGYRHFEPYDRVTHLGRPGSNH